MKISLIAILTLFLTKGHCQIEHSKSDKSQVIRKSFDMTTLKKQMTNTIADSLAIESKDLKLSQRDTTINPSSLIISNYNIDMHSGKQRLSKDSKETLSKKLNAIYVSKRMIILKDSTRILIKD